MRLEEFNVIGPALERDVAIRPYQEQTTVARPVSVGQRSGPGQRLGFDHRREPLGDAIDQRTELVCRRHREKR